MECPGFSGLPHYHSANLVIKGIHLEKRSKAMRKLVTIRRVEKILPIPKADAIELARIDGWQCIVKKGTFHPGDFGVYFEVDAFLPIRAEFEFLRARCYRKLGEREGFRLRSMKLRGELSQGLLLPIEELSSIRKESVETYFHERTDLSDHFGVIKYEPPIPVEITDIVRGAFPFFVPKTNEERIQNLPELFSNEAVLATEFEITEKMDGTSFSAYYNKGEAGICSRNYELKPQHPKGGPYTTFASASDLLKTLNNYCEKHQRNLVLQGELCGPGIEKNRYQLSNVTLFLFNIYNIDTNTYLPSDERQKIHKAILEESSDAYRRGVDHVPILERRKLSEFSGIDALLSYACEAEALEGVVFKSVQENKGSDVSFKVISNAYLLSES
jgi:RNA ligase (TIGR02306 family)